MAGLGFHSPTTHSAPHARWRHCRGIGVSLDVVYLVLTAKVRSTIGKSSLPLRACRTYHNTLVPTMRVNAPERISHNCTIDRRSFLLTIRLNISYDLVLNTPCIVPMECRTHAYYTQPPSHPNGHLNLLSIWRLTPKPSAYVYSSSFLPPS